MPSDRYVAQQWLAEQIRAWLVEQDAELRGSGDLAAAILDTPGVEVETMTMYVGKPGGSWVAETRPHIMMPVESIHV
jgi:hypothetical protein